MLSASMPLILQPIIKKLREERQLSKVLSEFLWLRYGDKNLQEKEGELAILETQQKAISERMEELKQEKKEVIDLQNKQIKLERLTEDIKRFKPAYNLIKNNKNWRYKNDVITIKFKPIAEEVLKDFDNDASFIQAFKDWELERVELIKEIGKEVKIN
jgi:hypothetical protein